MSGYTIPAPSDLRARYPAFTSVDDSTINYWIADAQRFVTTAWSTTDYSVGILALAAHNMARAGIGTAAGGFPQLPVGVTSFRMGPVAIAMTPQAANAGDYTSTRYGQEYQSLLLRNRGGPLVAPSGVPPYGFDLVGWPVGWP